MKQAATIGQSKKNKCGLQTMASLLIGQQEVVDAKILDCASFPWLHAHITLLLGNRCMKVVWHLA